MPVITRMMNIHLKPFLKKSVDILKEDGKLLIAIENKFGLEILGRLQRRPYWKIF